jgi:hypothetical protein
VCPLYKVGVEPVVGIEHVKSGGGRPGAQCKIDAGVSRSGQPAIAPPDVTNAIGVTSGDRQCGVARFNKRAAIIDHDRRNPEVGALA